MNVQRWDVYVGSSYEGEHGPHVAANRNDASGKWVKHADVTALEAEVARMREALRDRDAMFCKALIPEDTRVIEAVTARFNAMRTDTALAPAQKDGDRG